MKSKIKPCLCSNLKVLDILFMGYSLFLDFELVFFVHMYQKQDGLFTRKISAHGCSMLLEEQRVAVLPGSRKVS